MLWSAYIGIAFRDYGNILVADAVLLAMWAFYGISGRSRRLSEMGYYGALWISFSAIGAILTYLAAYMRAPLYDTQFSELDRAIGFSWLAWFELTRANIVLDTLLRLAYHSLIVQILVSIILFAHAERTSRNRELFWTAVIALVITSALSDVFPAAGTFYHFNIELARAVHLPHLLNLLAGTQAGFSFDDMQGIVTFPSYHAAMAIIFMYVHRGQRVLFPLITALNALMLLSTPTHGGHYLVDIIAGCIVALVSIALLRYAVNDLSRTKASVFLSPRGIGASPTSSL
ncbi:hypothetical protein AZKH_4126 [Azoarcus sp. KH32C]|nr:hypothetical protein AZKH_4126 [Azoarcus sp. KH32C]